MNRFTTATLAALAAGCASTTTGPAKIISEPIGAGAEAIIRSVDRGMPLGQLPMNPVYEVQVTPGPHELNLLCIPKQGAGGTMGPVNIKVNVEPEKTYKLIARPSGKRDPVCDVTFVEQD